MRLQGSAFPSYTPSVQEPLKKFTEYEIEARINTKTPHIPC